MCMKMTKKKVFWIASVYVAFFAVIFLIDKVCHDAWCRIHDDDVLGILFITFLPLLPIFLLSLITYKLREEVFRSWLHFAYWWIPISLLFTLPVPDSRGGGGFGMHSFGSEDFAMVLSILFFFISLIIIVIRSLTLRGK